jgi:hypothetical protein
MMSIVRIEQVQLGVSHSFDLFVCSRRPQRMYDARDGREVVIYPSQINE